MTEDQTKKPNPPSLIYKLNGEIRLLESDFFIVKHLGLKDIIQHLITQKKERLCRLIQNQTPRARPAAGIKLDKETRKAVR